MFTVAVARDFIAHHFLVGGDWGPENELHSHHYRVEVQLEAPHLDCHGYLVDIVDIEQALDSLIAEYRDKILNELPEFNGLNPSIERLAKLFCDALGERLKSPHLTAVAAKVWENDIAWTSCRRELR